MSVSEAIKMAFKTIASYKLRTFLTMLGIIIGISSVITLVSFANGTKAQVETQINSLGSNLIYVNIIGRGNKNSLTYNETMDFGKIKGVSSVSPVVSASATVKRSERSIDDISISGINANYQSIRHLMLKDGRFISSMDLVYRTRTAVLGSDIAQNFFGFINPVGETIKIDGVTFKVVGVLQAKGSSLAGSDDERIFIPESTTERTFFQNGVKTIFIQTKNSKTVHSVLNKLTSHLDATFKDDEASYKIMNEQDMLDSANTVSNLMTIMLGGIASISLLVGGIGIMNIMLVSVTERTKEIGIRKAIGAKRRDILKQFLIESTMISLLGGLLGIFVGIGGSILIKSMTDIDTILSLNIILFSLAFSIGIGVFFGLLPAYKASKLSPIESLRYE